MNARDELKNENIIVVEIELDKLLLVEFFSFLYLCELFVFATLRLQGASIRLLNSENGWIDYGRQIVLKVPISMIQKTYKLNLISIFYESKLVEDLIAAKNFKTCCVFLCNESRPKFSCNPFKRTKKQTEIKAIIFNQ